MQAPTRHTSSVVHGLLSSQWIPSSFVTTQPTNGWQNSVVQGLWSLQSRAPPPWQDPNVQWSLIVHGFPSSHGLVLNVPPKQEPKLQWSLSVHALWSSHGALLKLVKQPTAESHPSSVHGLWSSQTRGVPPPQTPPEQVVPTMHAELL